MMASTASGPLKDLNEFLTAAELQQYYNNFVKDLKINTVSQIKYVEDNDLVDLGMSKPEIRRLRQFFKKHHPHGAFVKFKKAFAKGDTSPSSPPVQDRQIHLLRQASNKHIIQEEAVTTYKTLGRGEFGLVQQGVWTNDQGEQIQVAVKCLMKDKIRTQTADLLQEATNMHSIDHPNIVVLYGVVLGNDSFMLVTELAPLRSLLECLKEPALRGNFGVIMLCDLAAQITDGMAYLESRRLVHRDLAARNVLMFTKDRVKICDFGLSRVLGVEKDYYQSELTSSLKLPIAWCAPECVNFLKFSSASDVWAFGVTLWEMFSYGARPWAGHTSVQILEAVDLPNSQRLKQPDHCPDDWFELMNRCWLHEPESRPTFADIHEAIPGLKPSRLLTSRECLKEDPTSECLRFKASEFITVLSKIPKDAPRPGLWKGALEHSNLTGYFDSGYTTPVLEVSASAPMLRKIKLNRAESARTSVRSSRRLDASMISNPHNDLRHIGHVGYDGAVFGDVAFIGNNYDKLPIKVGNTRNPDNDLRSSCISLPLNGSSQTVAPSSSSSTICGDKSGRDDDFGDFSLPDLSMGFDMGGSLMDEVMKALTSVSGDDFQTLMDDYSRAPDVTYTKRSVVPVSPGHAEQEDSDDSDSTAGPSSPNEGNSATESENEAAVDDEDEEEERSNSFDSSSGSSRSGTTSEDRISKPEKESVRSSDGSQGKSVSVSARTAIYENPANSRLSSNNGEESSFLSSFKKSTDLIGQSNWKSNESDIRLKNESNAMDYNRSTSNTSNSRAVDDWLGDSMNTRARNSSENYTAKVSNGSSSSSGRPESKQQSLDQFLESSSDKSSSLFTRKSSTELLGSNGSNGESSIVGARSTRGANLNLRAPQGIPGAKKAFINPGAPSQVDGSSEMDTNPLRRLRESQPVVGRTAANRQISGGSSDGLSSTAVGSQSTTRNLNVNLSFFDKLKEQEQQRM